MVSDSNKFVLIRSEGRGSVGKQLVLRTASTYQLLVKAPSWLHWDWLLKWWGCTATSRCSVIVGMQISSINETSGGFRFGGTRGKTKMGGHTRPTVRSTFDQA